jgi:hypothetical protein
MGRNPVTPEVRHGSREPMDLNPVTRAAMDLSRALLDASGFAGDYRSSHIFNLLASKLCHSLLPADQSRAPLRHLGLSMAMVVSSISREDAWLL